MLRTAVAHGNPKCFPWPLQQHLLLLQQQLLLLLQLC
jgi:hypothetical protein